MDTMAAGWGDFPFFIFRFSLSCTNSLSRTVNHCDFSHPWALLPIQHTQLGKKPPARADQCQLCGTH